MDLVATPRTVDLMINAACNLSCPFCYGPDPDREQLMTADDFVTLIAYLADTGVEGIVVSGGEPTLRTDLRERLDEIVDHGMWIALQSNGTRRRQLHEVLDRLRWLALPLDTLDPRAAKILRTSSVHQLTTGRAARTPQVLEARARGMKLKISTVVTRTNLTHLPGLAEEVADIAPDVWKIHQFRPRGEGRLNRDWLQIQEEEFDEAVASLPSTDFPISTSRLSNSVNAYLIINPDSTVLVTQDDHYLSFGRLVAEGSIQSDVFLRAIDQLDATSHLANSLLAFPDAAYSGASAQHQSAPARQVSEPRVHLDRG